MKFSFGYSRATNRLEKKDTVPLKTLCPGASSPFNPSLMFGPVLYWRKKQPPNKKKGLRSATYITNKCYLSNKSTEPQPSSHIYRNTVEKEEEIESNLFRRTTTAAPWWIQTEDCWVKEDYSGVRFSAEARSLFFCDMNHLEFKRVCVEMEYWVDTLSLSLSVSHTLTLSHTLTGSCSSSSRRRRTKVCIGRSDRERERRMDYKHRRRMTGRLLSPGV